ncbi:hypothetical protein Tco_0876034 [Tanacetum coccineum]|uniref:Uncharacterized protein n=1 Tax=Tanacetum coccineum TaxID=301880 RepID=A0ABQ5BUL2_9ASTR
MDGRAEKVTFHPDETKSGKWDPGRSSINLVWERWLNFGYVLRCVWCERLSSNDDTLRNPAMCNASESEFEGKWWSCRIWLISFTGKSSESAREISARRIGAGKWKADQGGDSALEEWE